MTGNGHGENAGGRPRIPSRDPVRPNLKRFYKTAAVEIDGDGFRIHLDGRPVRTPGKAVLAVTSKPLAEAIASEWQQQGAEIDPATMPLTRILNSAIDGVSARLDEVKADIVAYAGSDLVCYRAEAPPQLVAEQARAWDPILTWAKDELGARFLVASGIMPVTQSVRASEAIAAAVAGLMPLEAAAIHTMVTLTGSALIALAHAQGRLGLAEAWAAAHVDEDWQIRQWGEDAEAKERRRRRLEEMKAASRILELLRA